MTRPRKTATGLTLLLVAFVGSVVGVAQSTLGSTRANAVIVANAPVFLTPDEHREPLVVAREGSTVRRVGAEGEWYVIEFDDPRYGARAGYIQKLFLKLGVPADRPSTLPTPQPLGVVVPRTPPPPPAPPQLDDEAVAMATAMGERGEHQDLAFACSSARVKETLGHRDVPVVTMRVVGARGDIAFQAADAKRADRPWSAPRDLRDWHIQVLARSERGGRLDNIVLKAGARVAMPDALTWDGVALFTSAAAQAIVANDAFDVIAMVNGGQRTCTVDAKDKKRLGL